MIPTIAPFLLPVLTKKAEAQLPKLRLILREDVTASLLEQLRQGEIDLAIIALPYDIGNLLAISLYDDELRLVAQKGDPLATKKNLKADTSLLDRLVLLEEGHCLREHALYACSKPQNQESPGLHATSLLTILGMVEAGLGVSLIPEMAINNGMLGKRDLVTKQFSGTKPKRTIALVTRKSTSRLIAINALADILRF